MTIKIQVSLVTTAKHQMMLIYNKDRSFQQEFPASPEVLKMMKGRPKIYADADVIHDELIINREVLAESW
jgi:hypothetical protein